MVSATIPGYRAANHAVNRDLEHVRRLGIEFRYGHEVGTSVTLESLRGEGFGTIIVAVGARRGRPLGLEGEGAQGVFDGLDFLRAVRRGEAPQLGRRIGVVGGGDVAMDCARSARRLSGGRVTVYYRRTRREMPAQDEEIRDLLDEGGRIVELATPARILESKGRIVGVEMSRMRLGDADASGRSRPQIVEGAEFEVEVDSLIVAIGQRPDLSVFAGQDVALNAAGYLEVDSCTLETSLPGVYAGGDIIGEGPASIVKAAGDGRRIAEAILAAGAEPRESTQAFPGPWPQFDRKGLMLRRARTEWRAEIPTRPPGDRTGFEEVILTLSPGQARHEAARCLDCDLMCSTCETVCPNRAIVTYTAVPGELRLPTFKHRDGRLVQSGTVGFPLEQGPQVAVLADACNECGNCVTFCPTSGRPWRDKPRFFLHRGDFESENDNAFMLLHHRGLRGIQARFGGELYELLAGDRLFYSSDRISIEMDVGSLETASVRAARSDDRHREFDPTPLGSMISLIRALTASLPELPVVVADPRWILGSKTPL
jgi:putative selenate reductase